MRKAFLIITLIAILTSCGFSIPHLEDSSKISVSSLGTDFVSGVAVQKIDDVIYFIDSLISADANIFKFENDNGFDIITYVSNLKYPTFVRNLDGISYEIVSEVNNETKNVFLLEMMEVPDENIQTDFYYEDIFQAKYYIYNENTLKIVRKDKTKGNEEKITYRLFNNGTPSEIVDKSIAYYKYPILVAVDYDYTYLKDGEKEHQVIIVINYEEESVKKYDVQNELHVDAKYFEVSGVINNKIYLLYNDYYSNRDQALSNHNNDFLVTYDFFTEELQLGYTTGNAEKIIAVTEDIVYVYSEGTVDSYKYNGDYIGTKYTLDNYKEYSEIEFYSIGNWILIYARPSGQNKKEFIDKFLQ